jgi:hypothetical protein
MKTRILASTLLALVFASGSIRTTAAPSTEPPKSSEHPKGAEHPEHPRDEAKSGMSMERLSKGIRDYIAQDAALKGGFFLVYDTVDKKPLQLTLVKVHEDKLAGLGGGVYFACTDLENADGVVYDLDFFMKSDDSGDLHTTEVAVHKKAGVARYGWKEESGVWTKVK